MISPGLAVYPAPFTSSQLDAGGFLYATQARMSCSSPTKTDRNPKRAERKRPKIATVRAFLSEVWRSNQATTAFAGGGSLMMLDNSRSRSPQYSNSMSVGVGLTNSIHLPSASKSCFWIIASRAARDFLSLTLATGNKMSWKVSRVSKSNRGGSVPLEHC
jgi:hypothetical protein